MIFNSLDFLLFFPTVYVLYLFSSHKIQNILLLFASYFFYGYWKIEFLSLIVLSTIIDYACSLSIESSTDERRRKVFLWISLIFNLGLLGYFKYYNFFVSNAVSALQALGFNANFETLKIILPLGISFYTFQTMSYTIDVYRKQIQPIKNFLDFALYVSFFPQLVAGPIERATRLLPQIVSKRTVKFEQITEGTFLIALGYFKKVYVADNLSYIVDPIFASNDPSGASVLLAIYAFMFQIYCDFSGYSDIARGLAKYMGFELMLNFNRPILGSNIIEVWKRWHISLTTWLRDYIYVSLGGRNVSVFRQHINNLIVFLISGLWHGANWTYIIWGLYNGILTILYKLIQPFIPSLKTKNRYFLGMEKSIWIIFTATIFGYSGLFFRAKDMSIANNMTYQLFFNFGTADAKLVDKFIRIILPLLLIEVHQYINKDNEFSLFNLKLPIRVLLYLLLFYMIIVLGNFNKNEFIYFVF
jgi:alginate O-acetyltransferase complex protein AlgI